MEVEFGTVLLLDYYQGSYSGKQPFAEDILKRYRKVIMLMIEATNINELSKFRAMNIEKYERHWSARINDQYRLEFQFIKPNTIVILKISKHYE